MIKYKKYLLVVITLLLLSPLMLSSRNSIRNKFESDNSYSPSDTYNIFDYLPDEDVVLVYDSDFGETEYRLKYTDGGYFEMNQSNDFSYVQKIVMEEKGLFLKETEQNIDIFFFISKEMITDYPQPVLQIPRYLKIGDQWGWEGYKVENDDSIHVKTISTFVGTEKIDLPAGQFDAIRIKYDIETSEGEISKINQWLAPKLGRIKIHAALDGGGFTGTILSLLGYDEIEFNLKKIKKN